MVINDGEDLNDLNFYCLSHSKKLKNPRPKVVIIIFFLNYLYFLLEVFSIKAVS